MKNVDTELFDLCREVYEKTKLGHPITDFERGIVIHWEDGQMFDFPTDELDIEEYTAPLYTSDYLDDKLPNGTTVSKGKDGNYGAWIVGREEDTFEESDSPIKARLKLTIALDDAGVKL